jgi:hypothetical protein
MALLAAMERREASFSGFAGHPRIALGKFFQERHQPGSKENISQKI